jgi:anoctamin-10
LTGLVAHLAAKLTDFENYETRGAYETAITRKIFIMNFITSYLPIFLTAFVYVPFGSLIVPYLDIFSLTVKPFAEHEGQLKAKDEEFSINPDRLRKQVIYFTVTAQIVNMALEVIVPYLKRRGFMKYKQFQSERAAKRGGAIVDVAADDPQEEKAFLTRVRNEAMLDVYDVTTDLREMVLQVSHITSHRLVKHLTRLVRLSLPFQRRLAAHRPLLLSQRLGRT